MKSRCQFFYTKYLFGCYLGQPWPLPYQLVTDIWRNRLLKPTIQWPYPYLIQVLSGNIFFLAFSKTNFDGSRKATTNERKSKLQIPRYAVDLVKFCFNRENSS